MHKKSDDLLRKPPNLVEVPPGFEPGNEGFADLCLYCTVRTKQAGVNCAIQVKITST